MKLTDRIKYKLIGFVRSGGYDIIIPNFYVGFYEMDMFKLSQSGFVTEYEIKISRSDFFADFKKDGKHWRFENKLCAANRFWFVVPDGLVSIDECPSYAGLLYFNEKNYFRIIKNAPLIHRKKEWQKYEWLAGKLAFRCWQLEVKLRKLKQTNK